jgi:hypothetical protein
VEINNDNLQQFRVSERKNGFMTAMTALISQISGHIKAGSCTDLYSYKKPLNQNKKPQTTSMVILPHGLRIFGIHGHRRFIKKIKSRHLTENGKPLSQQQPLIVQIFLKREIDSDRS